MESNKPRPRQEKPKTYYFALLSRSNESLQNVGMYAYFDDESTLVDCLCVLDYLGREVEASKVLADPTATFVAWDAELTHYALKVKRGLDSPLEQWRSIDVWKRASALEDIIDRHPDDHKLARISSTLSKAIKVDHSNAREQLVKRDVLKVMAHYTELMAKHKDTEPNWEEWRTHVTINERGVAIDKEFMVRYSRSMTFIRDEAKDLFQYLLGTREPRALQILNYINALGYIKLKSLNRSEVQRLLALEFKMPDHDKVGKEEFQKAIRFRTIRDALVYKDLTDDNKLARLEWAMRNCERLRGSYKYLGTLTGRWVSQGVNLHNLARSGDNKEYEAGCDAIQRADALDYIRMSTDKPRLWLLRRAFTPSEGCKLIGVDYSQIEARILAWFVGEAWKAEALAGGVDIYKLTASKMFNVPLDKVTSELRRYGKVCELAMGYGGGADALIRNGVNRSVANRMVTEWRKLNSKVVEFWERILKAYTYVYTEGKGAKVQGLRLWRVAQGVAIKLITGRVMVITSEPNKTTGATLTANVISAMARDVLAKALVELERKGIRVVMHTHDEIVAEVPTQDVDKVASGMCSIMNDASREVGVTIKYPLEISVGEYYS